MHRIVKLTAEMDVPEEKMDAKEPWESSGMRMPSTIHEKDRTRKRLQGQDKPQI